MHTYIHTYMKTSKLLYKQSFIVTVLNNVRKVESGK